MQVRIIDEHHEAYAGIAEMVESGLLPHPASLVHVDSHDDLDSPLGSWSCYELPPREYVERNLTSGDFLLPLLLKGDVQKVIHVNFEDAECLQTNVGSLSGDGRLIRSPIADDHLEFFPDQRSWLYQKTSDIASISEFVGGTHPILGIDCDYFSWHRVPRPIYPFRFSDDQQERIRRHGISDDEYRMRLRILPHQLPTISGLTFNDSKAWIELFIDYFCFYLSLDPSWTFVARSAKSGFTPEKYIHVIEERLVAGLTHPPARLNIPLGERLELSPFVMNRGQKWYSFSTNQLMMACPMERIIIQGISNGETIGMMREGFLKRCKNNEWLADYQLLRTLFNLKKTFLIQ